MAEYPRPVAPPSTSIVERRHASTDRAIFVAVPERRLLAVDGIGKLRAADYHFAAEVLADVHRSLRMRLQRDPFSPAAATPLAESLWWPLPDGSAADIPGAFRSDSAWHWRQMVELDRRASDGQVVAAIDAVRREAGRPVPLIRSWSFVEGHVAQILHVGGLDGLPGSVRRLFDGIAEAGHRPVGGLHLLFLADPDRVPPGRGRVIVRQPIA